MAVLCFLMENHDQSCRIWKDHGVRQRILLHLDAHHDMWWIPENGSVTIGNFLCPALRNDYIREMFWVVPDPTWESTSTRRPILKHLEELTKTYPGSSQAIQAEGERLSTRVLGKPLHVCPVRALPRLTEAVLLDIDVDFFLIPYVVYQVWDVHGRFPWYWPDDLVARLESLGVTADLITIAYSVEGGYTPLLWKYLGDELALRLRGCADENTARGMRLIRDAALAGQGDNLVAAERMLEEAAALLPASAAPLCHLAHLCAAQGRREEGRRYYQAALDRDPAYRTPYNSGGLWNFWAGRFRTSEQEHRRLLELDPEDAYAYYGLGRLAARKRHWQQAEACYRRSIASNPTLIDSYRGLAGALAKLNHDDEAIQAYVHSLELALRGHRALGAPIVTYPEGGRLQDPAHWHVHSRLARLYEKKGVPTKAIQSYRMAIAGGSDGVSVRGRLAFLYLEQKDWKRSLHEARQAGAWIPAELWKQGRRLLFRMDQAIRCLLQ